MSKPRSAATAILAWLAGAFAITVPADAHATPFRNQFIAFEAPDQWSCSLEGAEYTCQDTREQYRRDAMIVLAAKLKGDQDSFEAYRAYLSQPKKWKAIDNTMVTSKVLSVTNVTIGGHPWVDATQDDSEVPHFRTRYLATLKDDIAVLVTFSVRQDRYAQMAPQFDAMLKTLAVKPRPGSLTAPVAPDGDAGGADPPPPPEAGAATSEGADSGASASEPALKRSACGCSVPGGSRGSIPLTAILVGVASAGWRRRRGRRGGGAGRLAPLA